MKHVLITGGTGFIGRHVTAEFLRRGYDVTVISKESKLPEQPGLNSVNLDLLNENAVCDFMAKTGLNKCCISLGISAPNATSTT